MKTEKRLKKMADEKKLRQMSSTDTPLQTVEALQKFQSQSGQAYITLSTGANKS